MLLDCIEPTAQRGVFGREAAYIRTGTSERVSIMDVRELAEAFLATHDAIAPPNFGINTVNEVQAKRKAECSARR